MARWPWLWLGVVALGGCGGQYILTVPDQLAAAGGLTATVVRLQRNDFFVLAPAVEEAAMRLRIADGPERGAYTDEFGYAGAAMAAPAKPGRYALTVKHLDIFGDEVVGEGPVYVWAADRPAVAVDLDCLPGLWLGDAKDAAGALRGLATKPNILYLTRRSTRDHAAAHEQLRKAGYPDGPILLWRRQRWHIVRDGRLKLPRVVVETRLVNQLPEVRKMFPKLDVGICDSSLAAKAFAAAGLRCVVVGPPAGAAGEGVTRHESWADLAQKGL